MKKLEKIKLSNYKEILVNKELSRLLGGSDDDDIYNMNDVVGCFCEYNNNGLIHNKNHIVFCVCNCI